MTRHRITEISMARTAIAPSLLAADFSRLGDDIRAADTAGADVLHVDIMDGHFVPNLTIGPPVVAALRDVSSLPFDVHLMLTHPEQYVAPFVQAGADNITIHVEIEGDVAECLRDIRQKGCTAGISLRPATPAASLLPYLNQIDLILVMTVEPGFGGQAFMPEMLPKIREIRACLDRARLPVHLEVDGGIDANTAPQVVAAGANLLVAGTSVFRAPQGIEAAIRDLRGDNAADR